MHTNNFIAIMWDLAHPNLMDQSQKESGDDAKRSGCYIKKGVEIEHGNLW